MRGERWETPPPASVFLLLPTGAAAPPWNLELVDAFDRKELIRFSVVFHP